MSVIVSEAAKRLTDEYMDMLLRNRQAYAGKWMAFRLDTGASTGVVYDTSRDARRFNQGPFIFLHLQPDGIREKAARTILAFHRGLWDAGIRFADPDGPLPVVPHTNDPMNGVTP